MSVIIEGNASYIPFNTFQPKIQKCLDLLKKDANSYYLWLLKYNLKVRAAAKSGANFKDASIDIAKSTFDASETWLASVLIHEAVHFWQYRSGKYKGGDNSQKEEQEANTYQLGVLQLLKAPQSEIDYMLSQQGKHADRNGDGVYDEKDYADRDY
jgi:hypothetical protein